METLVLNECYGYRLLDITSKSINNLVFSGYFDPEDGSDYALDIIEINAPDIVSLTIRGNLWLWKVLLGNVSSLVEANLDYNYKKLRHWETTPEEAEEEMLKGFMLKFHHVKEIKIGVLCSEVNFLLLSQLKYLQISYDLSLVVVVVYLLSFDIHASSILLLSSQS